MRAGRLPHRIAVLIGTASAEDGRGGRSKTWSTLAVVQGAIVPMSGAELETAQRLTAGVTHAFRMRYSRQLAGRTPQDLRLWWSRRMFEVQSLREAEGQHRELEGECKEQPA